MSEQDVNTNYNIDNNEEVPQVEAPIKTKNQYHQKDMNN